MAPVVAGGPNVRAARGDDAILEKCGVGGLRVPEQVKCLHLHYAHFLATGDNLVGEWCQNALDEKIFS